MRPARNNIVISNQEIVFKVSELRALEQAATEPVDRIYFGHEYCERLLPDIGKLEQALKIVRRRGKKFALLTPSVSEYGLKLVTSLVAKLGVADEVVVNDYGVLHMLGQEFKSPVVIGRVLGRIVLPALSNYSWQDQLFDAYLAILGRNIIRVETDYLKAPLLNAFLADRLKFSLYAGLQLWTTTKRCAFNRNSGPLNKFGMCRKDCLSQIAVVRNRAAGTDFLLRGNCLFSSGQGCLIDADQKKVFCRVVFDG